MIEFALLFGLGFLSAALLIMLIAPAVHGRVVRYTENRIKATLPISPQEVRAQRDMARAVYAAENARSRQELVEERDRAFALQLKSDKLSEETNRLQSEASELRAQIEVMNAEAADARSQLRQEATNIQNLKETLASLEESTAAKDEELENLNKYRVKLTADMDNRRMDISALESEIQNLKTRISALRDERDGLREEVRQQTTRAKDAEIKYTQEESRVRRLEEKLAKEIGDRADRETMIERREQELERLRDKLKTANAEARDASRALRNATLGIKPGTSKKGRNAAGEEVELRELPHEAEPQQMSDETVDKSPVAIAMSEDVRARATALSDRLLEGDENDAEIREQLAAIAADMVAITGLNEGKSSPIHKVLSGKSGGENRQSLAARSKAALSKAKEAAE